MIYAEVIIKLLGKDNYHKYAQHLNKSFFGGDKSPWWDMFMRVKEYHDNHEGDLSLETLKKSHFIDLAGSTDTKKKSVEALYELMEQVTTTDESDYLLPQVRRRGVLAEIGDELAKELQDAKEANVAAMADKLNTLLIEGIDDEEIIYTNDLLESEQDYQDSRRWRWFHDRLDEAVQGAGPGRNCLVIALTNVGKTSFVCRANVDFMRQGARVLHLAIAEDSRVSLQRRYYQAAFEVSDYELDQNKVYFRDLFMDGFADKLMLAPTDALTVGQAEELIKRFKPDIVVFDDFKDLDLDKKRNVDGKDHKLYGNIAVKIKSLAIKYNFFALCCAQAGDSATGKHYLERHDIADSKVDIPAKFQYVIGLARGSEGSPVRYLSTPKNKLGPENFRAMLTLDEARCKWNG